MKYIIIGLGNFGSTLASSLTDIGHEVFGVDANIELVEQYKDRITHTICMDTSKPSSIKNLPLKDADQVIVAIGEDVGASILTTALLKQYNVKKIIGRGINPLHSTVLASIGIENIFNPEQIAAEMFAKQLEMRGVVESFDLSENVSILEIEVPERYIGRTIASVDFEGIYNLKFIAIKNFEEKNNIFGMKSRKPFVQIQLNKDYKFLKEDILVMMGNVKDFQKMIGRSLR